MYRPERNWLPASSFVEPVTVPGVEPDSTPGISPCFSAAWLPYILGCLQQLAQPTTWDATGSTLQTALDQSQALIEIFGNAEGCMLIRWSDGACAIQVSTDNGATWTDITGWDINGLAACLQQPLIDIGGAPGTGVDGPGNPFGVSTAQMACNIANWLAVQILQGSMSSLASSLASDATAIEAALGLFELAASFTGVGGLFFTAAGLFIAAGTAIGETALNTAASSSTLRDDIVCAIYSAIKTDGKVTLTNFTTIVSNINAISYATPGIVGLIKDYVQNLGYNGLNAIQSEGALFDGNCAACGGGAPCVQMNGTTCGAFVVSSLKTFAPTAYSVIGWIDTTDNTPPIVVHPRSAPNFAGLDTAAGNGGGGGGAQICNNNGVSQQCAFNGDNHYNGPHAVAFTWDGSTGSIYSDGVLITSAAITVIPATDGLVDLYIGFDGINYFGGNMADVRLYSGALSAADVASFSSVPVGTYPVLSSAPLVAQWKFNETTGNIAHDSSGNGHDAQATVTTACWNTWP